MRLVTYSIFQLQYHGSIPWVNEYHGWMSQYHGSIPWVNKYQGWMSQYHGCMSLTIPWVDATYNIMGKFHGWMNNMGGWIPWVDAISHSDQLISLMPCGRSQGKKVIFSYNEGVYITKGWWLILLVTLWLPSWLFLILMTFWLTWLFISHVCPLEFHFIIRSE